MFIINTTKIIEVFCFIDDFCKEIDSFYCRHPLPEGMIKRNNRGRRSSLSESEVLTILVLYRSGEPSSFRL